jgi:hypothetical protein
MVETMYEELALEREIKQKFGFDVDVHQPIVFKVPVSRTAEATLFLTSQKQLYLYISGQTKFLFGDIQKIVTKMGLKVEIYYPPMGRQHYFDEIGEQKFREVFPGRGHIKDDDIRFYRTLAPYNPALLLISEVTNGEVRQFDVDSAGGWRLAKKFTYRRIRTS